MALFCYCSSSPFTLLRFPKQSSSSKSFVPKTLVFTKSVPMMSATSSESVASSISHPLLQRLYCCSSSSSSTEHDEAPSTRIFIKGSQFIAYIHILEFEICSKFQSSCLAYNNGTYCFQSDLGLSPPIIAALVLVSFCF